MLMLVEAVDSQPMIGRLATQKELKLPGPAKCPLDLSEKLAAQEREIIEAALRESRGQVFGPSGAATKLGMPRSTLESKIRSLKINKNRFKTAASSKSN
jgi:DNA-binding NtrC family response regulator